jgi:hypothetical protein
VEVFGDDWDEGDEGFYVLLTGNSGNALIGGGWGFGTIANDDYYYDPGYGW